MDEPEVCPAIGGFEEAEPLKPGDGLREFLARGLLRIIEMVEMQLGFTVPAGHQFLQSGHVAVDRLLAGVEPGMLPGAAATVAMTGGDLRVTGPSARGPIGI